MQFTLHLFGGMFFLLCTIALLFLYFALPYGLVAGLNHFHKKRNMRKEGELRHLKRIAAQDAGKSGIYDLGFIGAKKKTTHLEK